MSTTKRARLLFVLALVFLFITVVAQPVAQWLLIDAAASGNLNEVQVLIKLGTDPCTGLTDSGAAVVQSSTYSHPAIVKLLLERGASPNSHISGGETALMLAARYANLDTVSTLLKGGADPNRSDGNGQTPLTYAEDDGRADIVRALKRAGARH